MLMCRRCSSGSKSAVVVPSSMRPGRSIAPPSNKPASTSEVFPAPPCPDSATLRRAPLPNFFISLCSRSTLAEWQPEGFEERARLLVRPGGGANDDIHAARPIHAIVLDLRERQLLLHPHGKVAMAIKRVGRDPAEVADPGERDIKELVQEIVHALSAQGHLAADTHPRADLERRDRAAGARDHRLLPGNRRHV